MTRSVLMGAASPGFPWFVMGVTAALVGFACQPPGEKIVPAQEGETVGFGNNAFLVRGEEQRSSDAVSGSGAGQPGPDSGSAQGGEENAAGLSGNDLGVCTFIDLADPDWIICGAEQGFCAGLVHNGQGCHAFCAAAGMDCAASFSPGEGCTRGALPMTCDDSASYLSAWCECVSDASSCNADCSGKVCGADGCGGICGVCSDGFSCSDGACAPSGSVGICGDGTCEGAENSTDCVQDCGAVCGDGTCSGNETSAMCSVDCGTLCGDNQCNGGETTANCPGDCGAQCGDGVCNGVESSFSCPGDCGSVCGDGSCNGGDNTANCPQDCGSKCGDGVCNGGDNTVNCPKDCGSVCGDGVCNGAEGSKNCGQDCGSVCGDGGCNGAEGTSNCPGDCGSKCGDGTCNGVESGNNCASDCGVSTPPTPGLKLIGYIDSATKSGGDARVAGWACHPGWGGSIDVHIYAGGPAGVGTIIKGGKADQPNEEAVGAACQTQEGSHRFSIPFTQQELNAHHGKAIYIHGISPVESGNFLIHNSGQYVVPSA